MDAASLLTNASRDVVPPGLLQRLDPKWLVIGAAVALVAWLSLVPLVYLVGQSFLTPDSTDAPAQLTLENYRAAFGAVETARLFFNSVRFAAGAGFLAFAIGAFLAWVNERTDTPCKSLFFALSVVPLVIPGILFTVSWILLASPKIGVLNAVLQSWFGTDTVFFNIYSMTGMIWVDGLHYAPMAFLLMSAAFRAMDPALEESALMSGASVFQIARRITLKLVWPAVVASLLILFVRALESFEVPALLGLPAGIAVYTSSIYEAVQKYPSEVGLASAYGVILLGIASACIYLQSRIVGRGRFATVTGKGFRPRVMAIGGWRYLTFALFVVYLAVAVVLPFLILLWSSLQSFYSAPSWAALHNVGFDAYRSVLAYPQFASAVWNSLLLAVGSATVIMLTASILCWLIVKTKVPGRWIVEQLAALPLVFPGIVLGLSIMVFYLTVGGGIYGTLWILLIAYVTRFIPYGMRYTMTSLVQLHRELEESAAMSGASWFTTFRRIVLPLLKPGLVAGWIYIVIVSVRELSSSILLYSPGTEVVSVLIFDLLQNGKYVELSALGVMLIGALLCLVIVARLVGRRFGVAEV